MAGASEPARPLIGRSHLLSEFVDGKDQFTATPGGLVSKKAPSTLYAADGMKVTGW